MAHLEQDFRTVIESEVANATSALDRFNKLKLHTSELYARWVGFARIETLPARARLENDLFRALLVSLEMTCQAAEQAALDASKLCALRDLARNIDRLRSSTGPEDITAFSDEAKEVLK